MKPEETPLLLHSLLIFRSLIFRCLEIADARRVVEIGSESGEFTVELADWVADRDGTVVSVDPDPSGRVISRAKEDPRLRVVAGASPGALHDVEAGDVHIIDGDHNYWTVLNELRHAYGGRTEESPGPLCVLHDVGWPCARRDMYYAPDRLPADAVHPHSHEEGAVPGRSELAPGGFRGHGNFAWACQEGGERNGVLTAIEDGLEEMPGLRLVILPAVFGVGFVWPEAASWASEIERELERFDGDRLLDTLERNRLALYLRVLELQDASSTERLRADRVIGELQDQVGRLEAQNARLRLEATTRVPAAGPAS